MGTWEELVPGVHVTPFFYDEKGYGETFLVVQDGTRVALVSGRCSCFPDKVISDIESHIGRLPTVFIGPVMLEKKKKPVVKQYSDALSRIPELYINHCVGKDGMVNLRVNLGLAAVKDFYVGDVYKLN